MAVNYTVVPKESPQDREAPKKCYAQAKSSDGLTFRKPSKEITAGPVTVSDTGAMAALSD